MRMPPTLNKIRSDFWTIRQVDEIIEFSAMMNQRKVNLHRDDFCELWQKQFGRCAITNHLMGRSGIFDVGIDRICNESNHGLHNSRLVLLPLAILRSKRKYSLAYHDIRDPNHCMSVPQAFDDPIIIAILENIKETLTNNLLLPQFPMILRIKDHNRAFGYTCSLDTSNRRRGLCNNFFSIYITAPDYKIIIENNRTKFYEMADPQFGSELIAAEFESAIIKMLKLYSTEKLLQFNERLKIERIRETNNATRNTRNIERRRMLRNRQSYRRV